MVAGAEVQRDLIAQLRQARQACGLSQAAIAESIGCHRASVPAMEMGRQRMSLDRAAAYALTVGLRLTLIPDENAAGAPPEARPAQWQGTAYLACSTLALLSWAPRMFLDRDAAHEYAQRVSGFVCPLPITGDYRDAEPNANEQTVSEAGRQ